MATEPSAPTFSPQALAELEAKVDQLNQQLQLLNNGLAEAESDAVIDQQLQVVNAEIAELRRQWRALLELPPPKL
jgi:chromosome segregation ATPase